MEIQEIDINNISIKFSHSREYKKDDLEESIKEVGLIYPIVVNKKNELISGSRRLQVFKRLKRKKIPALIIERSSVDEELICLDENLARLELKGPDFSIALSRRKALYEQKYPHTKKGISGGVTAGRGRPKIANDKMSLAKPESFVENTSKKLGKSKKFIERAVKRADDASEKTKNLWKNEKLYDAQIDELIKLPKSEQDKISHLIGDRDRAEIRDIVSNAKQSTTEQAIKDMETMDEISKRLRNIITLSSRLKNHLEMLNIKKIKILSPNEHIKSKHHLIELREQITTFLNNNSIIREQKEQVCKELI